MAADTKPGEAFKGFLVLVALVVVGVVAFNSCGGSSQSYKSITCKQWIKKANSDTSGALTMADDFMNTTGIDPKGGVSDAADFGDTISGVCGPMRLGDTTIYSHKSQIVEVFLSVHPKDAP